MKNLSFIQIFSLFWIFGIFCSCSNQESQNEKNTEESVEKKMTTILYNAPTAAPIDFSVAVPDEFRIAQSEQGGNYITIFSKDQGNLSLTILPASADKNMAIEAAKSRISLEGIAIKNDKAEGESYYLANTSQGVLETTVGNHNGRYYYWTIDHPADYGNDFSTMASIIKDNLTWK